MPQPVVIRDGMAEVNLTQARNFRYNADCFSQLNSGRFRPFNKQE